MYLPSSPDILEKYLYVKSGRKSLYSLSVFTTLILVIGMFLFISVNPYFFPYTIFALITGFYLFISYLIGILAKDFDLEKHLSLVTKHFDRSAKEEVDILLPICREPLDVLRNTWLHVAHLRAAHEGIINVFVLDDGKEPACETLAKVYGFHYITRETNEYKKAGNLRNAFTKTTAPFFVIFDADFCPRRDFLLETLPYMYQDEKVGIVQTVQYFEARLKELSVVERGCAQIQELFYRLIQVSRNYFNGAICVGTSAVYRRSALEKHGGTAKIGHSEDVHTSVLVMQDGGKLQYVPLILSKGICPDSWKQMFTMYYRWTTGSLTLMLNKDFWRNNMSVVQKLCFCTGFGYYVTTGLSALMAFMPSIYLLIFKPQYIFWFNIFWAIPSILLTNIYMRFWQRTGYSWAAVECRAVACYAHLFALVDILVGKTEGWIPTGSAQKSGRFELFKTLIVYHVSILAAILGALIGYRLAYKDFINFVPLIGLFIYYVATLRSVLMLK